MTWSSIDGWPTEEKPSSDPPTAVPSAAELAEARTGRLARRKEIRRRLAAAEIATELHAQISSSMADAETKKDALASAHCLAAQPVAAEISAIDERQLAAAVAKQPRDPGLAARRALLADELRRKNADLELAIETEDRILASLFVERREAGMQSGRSNVESELIQTASEALQFAVRIWSGKAASAQARLSSAQDRISRSGRGDQYAMALLADAESEVARCQENSAAAIKAAIDEP